MRKSTKSSKAGKIVWKLAPDVKKRVVSLLGTCDITWVRPTKIFCFRSLNAKTRACARIWGLNRIWQMALKEEAAYIIETISEKFDRLPDFEKDKV
ncbi:MAG: putative metallopeptidase, partial [Patescibacteria group bacterium]